MFTGRSVRPGRPQQSLIQRPRSNHDDGNVRSLSGSDSFGESRLIISPELAALREVDLDRGVREVLLEAGKRRNAVERSIEEDVVAELEHERRSFGPPE